MSSTERLYYAPNPHKAFDATVRRAELRHDGTVVWLDRTAFYPTSGGQPHDVGTLGGVAVLDVFDDADGDVVHLLAGDGLVTGTHVHGEVDWARRLDHMQQHTGQHLLSAVVERLFGARTLSFHLGSESSTLDLDRELGAAQLAAAELEANRGVLDNHVVSVRYVSEDEAARLPLRKEPARTGILRLIEIESVDLSACGGTHVDRTGAIGQVALVSWERFKGGQRVEFICGLRALCRYQQLREASVAATRLLSVLPTEVPSAIERLQADLKEQRRIITGLEREWAGHEVTRLANAAIPFARGRLVLQAMDADASRLKALAAAAVREPGLLMVLVTTSNPALVVAARASDVTVSCHDLVAELARSFSGRGGGRPDFAQCGGLQAEPETILAAARVALDHQITGGTPPVRQGGRP